MYVGITRKSFARFFTLALLMSSWPLRIPPSSRPMITRTIAISTRVNPDCCDFMVSLSVLGNLPVPVQTACQSRKILFFRASGQGLSPKCVVGHRLACPRFRRFASARRQGTGPGVPNLLGHPIDDRPALDRLLHAARAPWRPRRRARKRLRAHLAPGALRPLPAVAALRLHAPRGRAFRGGPAPRD